MLQETCSTSVSSWISLGPFFLKLELSEYNVCIVLKIGHYMQRVYSHVKEQDERCLTTDERVQFILRLPMPFSQLRKLENI